MGKAMKYLTSVSLLALSAVAAQAGGIERSHSPYAILWEKGNYVELSYGRVMPDLTGERPVAPGVSLGSGNILEDFSQVGLGLKYQLNSNLDLAIVFDQPMGADIAYPGGLISGPAPYPIAGSNAEIETNAITAMLRYKFDDSWSVHGGLKLQRTKGNVELFNTAFPGGRYAMETSSETDAGFLIGAAYERPDIALRVGLTYQSAIKHDFEVMEGFGPGAPTTAGAMEVETPQSLTLDFQSGIAADTLLFGSLRWREWSAFDITPPLYSSIGSSDPQNPNNALVDYPRNVVTLNLGLGRKFTENFSGMVSIGYEKANDFRTSNLGPHNGMKSITVGGSWTQDAWKVSGGVSYIKFGDAETYAPVSGRFADNDVVAVGVKVGYSF